MNNQKGKGNKLLLFSYTKVLSRSLLNITMVNAVNFHTENVFKIFIIIITIVITILLFLNNRQ